MNLFETITKEILLEISADDAYEKFYSSIPREDFDKIIASNNGKFNALVKILLNGILDKTIFKKDAIETLNLYNSLENKFRIFVSNKIKNKEYDSVNDLISDVYCASNGKINVITQKELYSNGFIKISEDEEYIATCTTNYASSHHFYGDSKWCTASDRFGQYDGFEYYSKYITNTIDYDEDDYDEDNYDVIFWKDKNIKAEAVLVQFVKKDNRSKSMQVQMANYDHFLCGCFFNDDPINEEYFFDYFVKNHEELFKQVTNQLPQLINLTKEQRNIELEYELSRDEYVEKRRELESRRREIRFREARAVCENKNKEQEEKVIEAFNQIVSSKKYLDADYINMLHDLDQIFDVYENLEYDINDENAKREVEEEISYIEKCNYMMKSRVKKIKELNDDGLCIGYLELIATPGVYYDIRGETIYRSISYFGLSEVEITIVVEADLNSNKILSVLNLIKKWPDKRDFYTLKDLYEIKGGVYDYIYFLKSFNSTEIRSIKTSDYVTLSEFDSFDMVFKYDYGIVGFDSDYVYTINLIEMTYTKSLINSLFTPNKSDTYVIIDGEKNVYYTNSKRDETIKINKIPDKEVSFVEYLNNHLIAVYISNSKLIRIYKIDDMSDSIAEASSVKEYVDSISYKPIENPSTVVSYSTIRRTYYTCDESGRQIRCDKNGNIK